jgi:hypothetical protein
VHVYSGAIEFRLQPGLLGQPANARYLIHFSRVIAKFKWGRRSNQHDHASAAASGCLHWGQLPASSSLPWIMEEWCYGSLSVHAPLPPLLWSLPRRLGWSLCSPIHADTLRVHASNHHHYIHLVLQLLHASFLARDICREQPQAPILPLPEAKVCCTAECALVGPVPTKTHQDETTVKIVPVAQLSGSPMLACTELSLSEQPQVMSLLLIAPDTQFDSAVSLSAADPK